MNNRSKLAAIGGYQPFLFCLGMYLVSLFFSIFICSAIFYAINPKQNIAAKERPAPKNTAMLTANTVLLPASN